MNPDLTRLQPYPFEKIRTLLADITPPANLPAISLAIGEPKHATPTLIKQAVADNLAGLNGCPPTKGRPELRVAISQWLTRGFELPADSINPDQHVLPVNGTREALFTFAQIILDRTPNAAVLMPNPFYQIYEGAALLAGAEPVFLNCTAENGFIPDFDAISPETWQRCQLLYTCTPGNPTGAVMPLDTMQQLIELAPSSLPVFIVGGLAELYTPHLKNKYGDRCQPAIGNALNGLYTYAKEHQELKT